MLSFKKIEVFYMELYLNNEQSLSNVLKDARDGDIIHLASRVYYEK